MVYILMSISLIYRKEYRYYFENIPNWIQTQQNFTDRGYSHLTDIYLKFSNGFINILLC